MATILWFRVYHVRKIKQYPLRDKNDEFQAVRASPDKNKDLAN